MTTTTTPPRGRTTTSRPAFRRGQLDGVPLVLGYLPFGLVLGATIATSSVPDLAGWATSALIFAGAAQLAVVELADAGAAAVVVVTTALVINLRHVMYSAGLVPWFRDEGLLWRALSPVVLTDPQYSMAVTRFPGFADAPARRGYYVGLASVLWPAWMAMTAAGIVVGARLPDGLSLDLAVPLVFLALLVPTVDDRPTLAAAVTGGVVAVAARGAPLHLGLLIGAVAGIVAGLVFDEEVRR